MKKLILFAVLGLSLSACNKENEDRQYLNDGPTKVVSDTQGDLNPNDEIIREE